MFKFSNEPFHPFPTCEDFMNKHLRSEKRLLNLPTIPEFFKDKEIFITGGSGFVGKALIEKILRSCPEVKTIFILLREKRGQSIAERLQKIINLPIFDILKIKSPNFTNKLIPIAGDVSKINLDLSESDKNLMKNVSIIFHSAATVRFDESLKIAIFNNTRGTREVLRFAESLSNLKAVVHVSTAYSNCHLETIEEKVHDELADWERTIEICEKIDENQIDLMTQHFINFMPNTYVFSKNLAEHVTKSYSEKIPVALVRPSIVMPALEEPFGGYFEGYNGAMGVATAVGTGVCQSYLGIADNRMEIIPVDIAVKSMIIAAWKVAHEPNSFTVYNCTSARKVMIRMGQIFDTALTGIGLEFPLRTFMPAGVEITRCKTWHLIRLFFLQLIPAMIFDMVLKAKGKHEMMMKIQRKIFFGISATQFFGTHEWIFKHDNFLALNSEIRCEDGKQFEFDQFFTHDVLLYLRKCVYGMRNLLFNLKDEDLEKDRKTLARLEKIGKIIKFSVYFMLFGIIYLIFMK